MDFDGLCARVITVYGDGGVARGLDRTAARDPDAEPAIPLMRADDAIRRVAVLPVARGRDRGALDPHVQVAGSQMSGVDAGCSVARGCDRAAVDPDSERAGVCAPESLEAGGAHARGRYPGVPKTDVDIAGALALTGNAVSPVLQGRDRTVPEVNHDIGAANGLDAEAPDGDGAVPDINADIAGAVIEGRDTGRRIARGRDRAAIERQVDIAGAARSAAGFCLPEADAGAGCLIVRRRNGLAFEFDLDGVGIFLLSAIHPRLGCGRAAAGRGLLGQRRCAESGNRGRQRENRRHGQRRRRAESARRTGPEAGNRRAEPAPAGTPT